MKNNWIELKNNVTSYWKLKSSKLKNYRIQSSKKVFYLII